MLTNLVDVPLLVTWTDADIVAARDWLKVRTNATGVFAAVSNGAITKVVTNGACHASLTSMLGSKTLGLIATLAHRVAAPSSARPSPRECDPVVRRRWFNWLTQTSHLARFCVDTDDLDRTLETGVLVNPSAPTNIVAMVCILSRHPYEFGSKLQTLFGLVDQFGMSVELAYVVAFNTTYPNASVGLYSAGHCVFDYPSSETVRNWVAGRAVSLKKSGLESKSYYGVSNAFGPGDYCNFRSGAFIGEAVNQLKDAPTKAVSSAAGAALANPFGSYSKETAVVTSGPSLTAAQVESPEFQALFQPPQPTEKNPRDHLTN